MAIDYNSIYNQIQNSQQIEELKEQEKLLKNQELSSIYNRIHGGSTPEEKTLVGYDENIGSVYKQISKSFDSPTKSTGKKSLTELAADEEFSMRSERFLEGVAKNENIFEYLRDSEYSLSSSLVRSFQAGKWTEEQKQDYNYLSNQFQNAELKGIKEHAGLIKDLGFDLVADPLNILGLLFAIPSGGTTLAGRAALGEAARQGTKQLIKQSVKSSKPLAKVSAFEGVTWNGLHDYFLQDISVDTGLMTEVDLSQSVFSGLVGGLAGGAIGGVIGTGLAAREGKKYLRFAEKEFNFAQNSNVEFEGPKLRKKVEDEYNIDQELDVETSQGKLEKITEKTIEKFDKSQDAFEGVALKLFGKSTSEFKKYVEDNPEIADILRKLRYDWDVGLLKEGDQGATKVKLLDGTESEFTYGEFYGRLTGKYLHSLQKIFNPLGYTGFWGKLTTKNNDALAVLLRDKTLNSKNANIRLGDNEYIYMDIDRVNNKNVYSEKTIKLTPSIKKAYKELRNILDEGYTDADNVGLFREGTINKKGFLPRLYKFDVLDKNKDEFADILIAKGHADPVNEKDLIPFDVTNPDGSVDTILGSQKGQLGKDEEVFGRNFLNDANGDMEVAKRKKAQQIVDDMLKERFTPYEVRASGKSNANGFLQPRRFDNIQDNEISKFLEDDVEVILTNYFSNLSQSVARKKYFGATEFEFQKKQLAPIADKMYKAKNPDGSRKYTSDELKNLQKGLNRLYARATGIDTFSDYGLKKNKYARNTKDWIILSQQASLLPFATLSSVTEPLILLSRASATDAPAVLGNIAVAMGKQTKQSFERLFKAVYRGTTGKETKGFSDLADEQWDELYQTGLALEQSVMERIEGLAGEALENPKLKKAQQAFFHSNLLTPWTKAVQLASFTTGKRIIKQHSEKLATGKTAYGKLTKGKKNQIIKELNQLGINENDAVSWYNKSLDSNGLYDESLAKGLNGRGNLIQGGNGDFYKNNVLGGANRFVKEIILAPRAAEANRPDWFGRPDAQFLIQFAGYPTVFNNTILKRFINELSPVSRDKNSKLGIKPNVTAFHNAPKTAITALLMTAVAHAGNEIRSNGKASIDYKTGKRKSEEEIMHAAVRRWGGLGPYDYMYRYTEESDRNVGQGTALLKSIGGPFPQDVIDMVLYRKGLGEVFVTNAPYYGAYDTIFGEGTKKKIRAQARGTYKKEKPSYKQLIKYAKGGIVKNVPNVTDEPDEMQSRVTGKPFNATSEAAQDIEDRELKGQMKGLGL